MAQPAMHQCQHPVTTSEDAFDLHGISATTACGVVRDLSHWLTRSWNAQRLYRCQMADNGWNGRPILKMHRYDGYRLKRDEPAVVLAAAAFSRCGIEPRYGLSGGGADANVFNQRGLRCVNLSHGVFGFHTPDEHVSVADLEAMVDVTVALVEEARA